MNKIVIKVIGNDYLNMFYKLRLLGINVYNSKIVDDCLYLTINNSDYQKIKKPFIMYEIKKYDDVGLTKMIYLIKKYKILLISLLLSFLFVFFGSFFIVDIEVIHEDEGIVNLIYDELEKNGIHKYQLKKSYQDLQKIKTKIKNDNLDKIDWLEISKVGMKYVIKVEKRIITIPKKKQNYCHIYAKKDGLIKKVKVYDGDGLININDYVKKGDILISGDIKRNEEVVSNTCAEGKIYAENWYTINIKIPLNFKEEIVTNKKRYNFIFNYDGIDYQLFNNRLKNYKSKRKEIFDLLGLKIYLKTDYEIKKITKKHSEASAIKEALTSAKQKIILKIDDEDKIISQKVLQKKVTHSTMDIDIFIVTEEQIGYQKVLKEKTKDDL